MPVNVQDRAGVQRAIDSFQTGPVGGWVLLGYADDNNVRLQSTGHGMFD